MSEEQTPEDNNDYAEIYYNPSPDYDDEVLEPEYHNDENGEDAPEPVNNDLQSENGQTQSGSKSPIIVASGIGLENNRIISRDSTPVNKASHNETGGNT